MKKETEIKDNTNNKKNLIIIIISVCVIIGIIISIVTFTSNQREMQMKVANINSTITYQTSIYDSNISFEEETIVKPDVIILVYNSSNSYTKNTYGKELIVIEMNKKDYKIKSIFSGNKIIENNIRDALEKKGLCN